MRRLIWASVVSTCLSLDTTARMFARVTHKKNKQTNNKKNIAFQKNENSDQPVGSLDRVTLREHTYENCTQLSYNSGVAHFFPQNILFVV